MRTLVFVLCLVLFPNLSKAAKQSSEEEAVESDGAWGFSGGASFGDGAFGVRASISYFINPYIGSEFSANYFQFASTEREGKTYGPELVAILRGANPTFLTPFVGGGFGYDIWSRTEEGITFDEATSPLGLYFAGINIGLSSHVGVSLKQTWTHYLDEAPRKFGDHSQRETSARSAFGFGLVFSF